MKVYTQILEGSADHLLIEVSLYCNYKEKDWYYGCDGNPVIGREVLICWQHEG